MVLVRANRNQNSRYIASALAIAGLASGSTLRDDGIPGEGTVPREGTAFPREQC